MNSASVAAGIELLAFDPSLGAFSAAVAIWRDIEPTPDAIAFDGVEFLR
jgi:hypothetical protein